MRPPPHPGSRVEAGPIHPARALEPVTAAQPRFGPVWDVRVLSPPPDGADLAEPSPLTCCALAPFLFFLLIKWSDKEETLSANTPEDSGHVK